MRQLVQQMTDLHDDPAAPRFATSGPNLKIGSRPSLSLSLILHELATNAVKHGALSVPTGSVDLRWRVVLPAADRFEMIWTERGGPTVAEPLVKGSGSRLISAGLNGTSDGHVDMIYAPEGLRCIVTADLESFQKEH
ncbi:sensor histidine kinase [Rhizobium sp. PP-CC-3G-465]|uniref:sensor histidine kinase n=1 Tax=Rhizobium sp. PP-CC-3G-465 TaxID=2135648 RepID=UPI001047FEFE|nr:hypothetical protein C8J33_101987 [Rhizobium sp. PP-CC-3G-465]